MIKIAIIAFAIVIGILIYLLVDHSKQAQIERAKSITKWQKTVQRKILFPANEFIVTHVPDEKKKKIEGKYRQAGFSIPYSINILICGGTCLFLAFLATTVLNNNFLGCVMLFTVWLVPSIFV